jgi:hypothetical protein
VDLATAFPVLLDFNSWPFPSGLSRTLNCSVGLRALRCLLPRGGFSEIEDINWLFAQVFTVEIFETSYRRGSPEFSAIIFRVVSLKRTISCQSSPAARSGVTRGPKVSVTRPGRGNFVLSRRMRRAPRTLGVDGRFESAKLKRPNSRVRRECAFGINHN